jgi:hypothetical protein
MTRDIATWIVQLIVDGPGAVRRPVRFQHPKGFNRRQFYSDIEIQNSPHGFKMSVTAFARERELARKAALVFVGEALDVLSTDLGLRLALTLDDQRQVKRSEHSVKRVVTEPEIRQAFGRPRWLSEQEPTFLRALSWFRKALDTENPLDRFLPCGLPLKSLPPNITRMFPEPKMAQSAKYGNRLRFCGANALNGLSFLIRCIGLTRIML